MNDLDKVYAESVAKEYMSKETNKVLSHGIGILFGSTGGYIECIQ